MQLLEANRVSWEEFQKQFKSEYLSDHYYDDRAKEFHELRLGPLTMYEFLAKFKNLLRYVRYMKEEKTKVQRLLNCLLASYKEKIEFYNLKLMDEVVTKVRLCYKKFMNRSGGGKSSKN